MQAQTLNTHILTALDATDHHEQAMAAAVEAVLNRAADEAARNFKAKATSHLAASGADGWTPPHPDEVVNTDKLGADIANAIVPHKDAALAAFTDAMPACAAEKTSAPVEKIVQAAREGVLPASVDRAYLRGLFDEYDRIHAAKVTPGRQRAIVNEIRTMTGLTPSTARRALEAEEGVVAPAKPAVKVVVSARAAPTVAGDNIAYLKQVYATQSKPRARSLPLTQIQNVGQRVTDELLARLPKPVAPAVSGFWTPETVGALNAWDKARPQVLRQIIDEVRGTGLREPFSYAKSAKSSGLTTELDQAAQVYPTEWLQAARDWTAAKPGGLDVFTTTRAFFGDYNARAAIALDGRAGGTRYGVAIHEIGHLMEKAVPKLRDLEEKFYKSRIQGEPLSPIYPTGDVEVGIRDEFANSYMGKWYGDWPGTNFPPDGDARSYELLTMGMQELFGLSKADNFDMWDRDPAMRNWILGLLVAVSL